MRVKLHPGQPVDVTLAVSAEDGRRRDRCVARETSRSASATRSSWTTFPCTVPARPDLRLPRTQRQRQDHDDPHDLRPAHARRRRAASCWATTSRREAELIKRAGRLHDAEVQPLRGPLHRGEPRLHRARCTTLPIASAAWSEALERLGLAVAQQAARRHALGRLEAAPRARRVPHPRSEAAAARRAHRRRRSRGAPRLLGSHPRARRTRASPSS